MNRKARKWLWLVVGVGLVSSAVFFPVPINQEFSCLFHRLFMSSEQIPAGHLLVSYYVNHFGLLWWGSLFLTAFILYQLLKKNQTKKG